MLGKFTTLARRASRLASHKGVLGKVDRVVNEQVHGWAFDPSDPSRRVRVRLFIDGQRIADLLAETYRPDVQNEGFGTGECGFSFHIPRVFLDNGEHTVKVVDVGSGRLLAGLDSRRVQFFGPGTNPAQIHFLFDQDYYRRQAGDVREPLDHFRTKGWKRGLQPHPLFDTRWYVRRHDLGTFGDPLTHFEQRGRREGASLHPLLDRSSVGHPASGAQSSVLEYLSRREARKPDPSSFFSDVDYEQRYPGVVSAAFLPLVHYLTLGWREGKKPHRDFDPKLFSRLADLPPDVEPYAYFVGTLLESQDHAEPVEAPRVSIVILNFQKALLTLQCLYFLEKFTPPGLAEVIIVDNGSDPADFAMLSRFARSARLVRVNANRGFGEGNNIGVEHARGEFVVFLNNDAFVTPGWLEALLHSAEANPDAAAIGGKLLFPDGALQEAGCIVSDCGSAVQRGKHLDPRAEMFNVSQTVDYCSAAMLMVRLSAFRSVLGFDLCWDPAYYEDSDLCLKLRRYGWRTVYEPACEIIHLEHATSSVPGMEETLRNVVATNRLKFVQRWSSDPVIEFGRPDEVVTAVVRPREPLDGSLALYTPYPLTPGGGERYLLTMAESFGRRRRCTLFTPDRYSRVRLLTMARELGLNLDHVELDVLANSAAHERHDVFVCMANEVLPPVHGIGRLNLFHCQFPFPLADDQCGPRWDALQSYAAVVVNSRFTAHHYEAALKRLGLPQSRLEVLSPPVPAMPQARKAASQGGVFRILSVGRFARSGHCKRQDLMIAAMARLIEEAAQPVELHLAGSVGTQPDGRQYLNDLITAARGLPVTLHPNASAQEVSELYASADLYWHLTGAGQSVSQTPEVFEHFGISVVEAMSAGVPPIALRAAGPAEIITDGVDGVLLDQPSGLVPESVALIGDPARRARMGAAAQRRAADFSVQRFETRLGQIVAACEPRPAAPSLIQHMT